MHRFVAFFAVLLVVTISESEARQYAPQFGASATVSGKEVFVSEGRNRIAEGSVYSFVVDGGVITKGPLITAQGAPDSPNGFGQALSASGNLLLVGAPLEGAVYAYEKNSSGTWAHQQRIASGSDGFGEAIYLNGNQAIIAESGGQESPGRAYVYVRDATGSWSKQAELGAEGVDNISGFGQALYIDGNIAILSSRFRFPRILKGVNIC